MSTDQDLTAANAAQFHQWNHVGGPAWTRCQERLDQQLRPHGARALAEAAIRTGEAVLDVGCGCGDTTLEIARRVGPSGLATGVDISAPMLARARERAAEAGLAQAEFLHADAQIAALPEGRYDVVFSRFGVMFFADPARAFENLARSLAKGGRIAFVCWQSLFQNPFMGVPLSAFGQHVPLPPAPGPEDPGMFSFADPARVRRILEGAGFEGVALAGEEIPTAPGAGGLDEAVEMFFEVGPGPNALREHPDREPEARAAVRRAFEPFVTPEGVRMGSTVWIVTARKAG
jgi:SAM-dependent methyltransferase